MLETESVVTSKEKTATNPVSQYYNKVITFAASCLSSELYPATRMLNTLLWSSASFAYAQRRGIDSAAIVATNRIDSRRQGSHEMAPEWTGGPPMNGPWVAFSRVVSRLTTNSMYDDQQHTTNILWAAVVFAEGSTPMRCVNVSQSWLQSKGLQTEIVGHGCNLSHNGISM